jgi:methylglutaconyl-CoA hydratase
LVAVCDVVVASTAASFALREVRVGVVPAVIAIPLRDRVSAGILRELALTGRSIDADEARDIGLVNWVTSPGDLDEKVHEVVGDLMKGGPAAQAATKDWLSQIGRTDERELLARAAELSAAMFSSSEATEGMRAFREKRSPHW